MKFTIYHTNDIHSRFDEFCSLITYIKEHKKDKDLLLDAGDFCDFKDVMLQGTNGMGGIELLRYAGYDAICIGNNEGFSKPINISNMAQNQLPMLSVNLLQQSGKEIDGVKKSILLNKEGIRFLIIGVTPYSFSDENDINIFFHMDQLHCYNPIPLITKEIENYKNQYDVCIVLSHLGYSDDCMIAKELQGIDVIIGGHSHTKLEYPTMINNTILCQAYEYAKGIGKIEFEYNQELRIIASSYIENTFSIDSQAQVILEKQRAIAINNLSKPLYEIEKLQYDPYQECELINFICDALYEEYPCDFTIMHHGIVSGSIEEYVSELKLIELSPSLLNPTKMIVLGQQIIDAYQLSLNQEHCAQNGRGPGFRGTILGTLGFSHTIQIHKNILFLNDIPINSKQEYVIVTTDYLQRGTGYPSLLTEREDTVFYEGFIKDVLRRNLNNKDLYSLSRIKRKKD